MEGVGGEWAAGKKSIGHGTPMGGGSENGCVPQCQCEYVCARAVMCSLPGGEQG